jgi:hypothetical protein
MSAELSDQPVGWDCARRALTEIRECPGEVQTLVLGVFDQLDKFVEEFVAQERVRQQSQRQLEREALQDQVDRLATVVAELVASVTEQKQAVKRISSSYERNPTGDYL